MESFSQNGDYAYSPRYLEANQRPEGGGLMIVNQKAAGAGIIFHDRFGRLAGQINGDRRERSHGDQAPSGSQKMAGPENKAKPEHRRANQGDDDGEMVEKKMPLSSIENRHVGDPTFPPRHRQALAIAVPVTIPWIPVNPERRVVRRVTEPPPRAFESPLARRKEPRSGWP